MILLIRHLIKNSSNTDAKTQPWKAGKCRDYDLCIYGHDHTYSESKVGDTLLVNPGAITPYNIDNSSFIIFDTNSRMLERINL
jgi:predicted phosphodiesterase